MHLFQFDAEFRRWSLKRSDTSKFEEFAKLVERLHQLNNMEFLVSYIDPRDNDLLPINNDDNYIRALSTAKPLLRVIVQRKGENIFSRFSQSISNYFFFYICIKGDNLEEFTGYGTMKPRNLISSILGQTPAKSKAPAISNPHDFRQVNLFMVLFVCFSILNIIMN